MVGPDLVIEAANADLGLLIGVATRELVGMRLAQVLADPDGAESPDDTESVRSGFRRIVTGRNAGHFLLCIDSVMVDHLEHEGRRILLFRSAVDHAGTEGESAQDSQRDPLTGLLGRGAFLDELGLLLHHAGQAHLSAAVAVVDLDGFSRVNERLGHDVGDEVLRTIARRLVGDPLSGHLIARLGADEFGVLIPTRDPRGPSVSRALHHTVHRPVVAAGHVVHLSASIGQAALPVDGRTADELLVNAGLAMRAAKDAGGDRTTVFNLSMNTEAHRRATLRDELMGASRSGGLHMLYQPIIDVGTGAVAAAEALVRLRRGTELVAAAEWMDVAEGFGLLTMIGLTGIRRVAADLRSAAGVMPDWRVSIGLNLSPAQLSDPETLDALARWEVPGGRSRVFIEVTESVALAPEGPAFEGLVALRALGYQLAVDDFGAGYSSIALLEAIRPDAIKIDRSLVVHARGDDQGRRIFEGTLALLRTLAATVTAEGIETEADMDLCRATGVDFAQGYLLAPPQPLATLLGAVP